MYGYSTHVMANAGASLDLGTHFCRWRRLLFRCVASSSFAVAILNFPPAAYTVYRLIRHRRNFGRIVAGAHSALTTGRFVRLAILSMSYLCIGVPLSLFSVIQNIATSGRYFDYSWHYFRSTVRFDFVPSSRCLLNPTLSQWHHEPILVSDKQTLPDLSAWSNVIVGFIFFAAFGFGTEALQLYKKAMKPCLGRRSDPRDSFLSPSNWR